MVRRKTPVVRVLMPVSRPSMLDFGTLSCSTCPFLTLRAVLCSRYWRAYVWKGGFVGLFSLCSSLKRDR